MISSIATMSVNPYLYAKLPYDPQKDFAPVGLIGLFDLAVFTPAGGRFATLADALAKSINTIPIQLNEKIGKGNHKAGRARVHELLRKSGFANEVRDIPGMPLGVSEVTVVDMATGFNAFANGGKQTKPYVAREILGQDGNVIYRAETDLAKKPEAMPSYVALDMNRMLRKVVTVEDVLASPVVCDGIRRLGVGKVDQVDESLESEREADRRNIGSEEPPDHAVVAPTATERVAQLGVRDLEDGSGVVAHAAHEPRVVGDRLRADGGVALAEGFLPPALVTRHVLREQRRTRDSGALPLSLQRVEARRLAQTAAQERDQQLGEIAARRLVDPAHDAEIDRHDAALAIDEGVGHIDAEILNQRARAEIDHRRDPARGAERDQLAELDLGGELLGGERHRARQVLGGRAIAEPVEYAPYMPKASSLTWKNSDEGRMPPEPIVRFSIVA